MEFVSERDTDTACALDGKLWRVTMLAALSTSLAVSFIWALMVAASLMGTSLAIVLAYIFEYRNMGKCVVAEMGMGILFSRGAGHPNVFVGGLLMKIHSAADGCLIVSAIFDPGREFLRAYEVHANGRPVPAPYCDAFLTPRSRG